MELVPMSFDAWPSTTFIGPRIVLEEFRHAVKSQALLRAEEASRRICGWMRQYFPSLGWCARCAQTRDAASRRRRAGSHAPVRRLGAPYPNRLFLLAAQLPRACLSSAAFSDPGRLWGASVHAFPCRGLGCSVRLAGGCLPVLGTCPGCRTPVVGGFAAAMHMGGLFGGSSQKQPTRALLSVARGPRPDRA